MEAARPPMERPPIMSLPPPRTFAATSAMDSLRTGMGSGRFEPFSRYGKLKRTTSKPTASSALARAVMLRSAMWPPAPCAQTNVATGLMLGPGVARLVDVDLPAARQRHLGHETPSLVLHCRARDFALRHLPEKCPDVLAGEEELVRAVAVAVVHRNLRRRQPEDEIAAVVDVGQLEHITQQRVIRLRVGARHDDMGAVDHALSSISNAMQMTSSYVPSRRTALRCTPSRTNPNRSYNSPARELPARYASSTRVKPKSRAPFKVSRKSALPTPRPRHCASTPIPSVPVCARSGRKSTGSTSHQPITLPSSSATKCG